MNIYEQFTEWNLKWEQAWAEYRQEHPVHAKITNLNQCSLCDQDREIPHHATLRVGNEVTRFAVCLECGKELSEIMDGILTEQNTQ